MYSIFLSLARLNISIKKKSSKFPIPEGKFWGIEKERKRGKKEEKREKTEKIVIIE